MRREPGNTNIWEMSHVTTHFLAAKRQEREDYSTRVSQWGVR